MKIRKQWKTFVILDPLTDTSPLLRSAVNYRRRNSLAKSSKPDLRQTLFHFRLKFKQSFELGLGASSVSATCNSPPPILRRYFNAIVSRILSRLDDRECTITLVYRYYLSHFLYERSTINFRTRSIVLSYYSQNFIIFSFFLRMETRRWNFWIRNSLD